MLVAVWPPDVLMLPCSLILVLCYVVSSQIRYTQNKLLCVLVIELCLQSHSMQMAMENIFVTSLFLCNLVTVIREVDLVPIEQRCKLLSLIGRRIHIWSWSWVFQ